MKNLKYFLTALISAVLLASNALAQKTSDTHKTKVEPAFRVLQSYPNVRDFTMNSVGDEAYVTIQSPLGELSVIAKLTKKNGKWQKPKLAKFSGKFTDLEPFFSPDGLKLYFASNRPIDPKSKDKKDMDIWYVERQNDKADWSQPKNLGAPINTEGNEFYPAVSSNGNLYFTLVSKKAKGQDDIFFSEWKNGKYSEPISLSESINTKGAEYNAYIAPDESFLIFGGWRRKDSIGSGDMYISFRNSDRTWKQAVNLGKAINSRYMEYCPFVDWRTKTLYFTSRRSNLYRKTFNSLQDFENETTRYDNGFSRIYKTPFANTLKNLMSRNNVATDL